MAISICSNLSTSIIDLAAWMIRLLAVWLTHGAPGSIEMFYSMYLVILSLDKLIPSRRLIRPRRSHWDLACKSNTSSNKFNAHVSAGYSDEC